MCGVRPELEEEEGSPHTELQVEDRGVRYLAKVIVVPSGQLRKYLCFSFDIIMIKYLDLKQEYLSLSVPETGGEGESLAESSDCPEGEQNARAENSSSDVEPGETSGQQE